MTSVKFVNIGNGHLVNANVVQAVIIPKTATGQRYSRIAREKECYIDCTMGKKLRSVLLLNDGSVMASIFSTRTLLKRFMTDYNESEPEEEKEEEPDEDH